MLSEASRCPSRETLRFAQGDNPLPILIVNLHYRHASTLAKFLPDEEQYVADLVAKSAY